MKIDGVWDETGQKEKKQKVFSIAVSHVKQGNTHKLKIFFFVFQQPQRSRLSSHTFKVTKAPPVHRE